MCYCDARSFTAQRCVAQCAALYSPPRNFWVREQQNNQCYNDLKRYRRCARLLLSAQLIYIQLFSTPPSLRSIVRIIALCPARRGSIVRSTAQCPSRFCHPNSRKCSHVCQEIHVGIGLTRRDTKCQNPPRHRRAHPSPQSRGAPRPFRPAV